MHLQENSIFDLDLGGSRSHEMLLSTHVTYSATKFDTATSNRLGVETFTRKNII